MHPPARVSGWSSSFARGYSIARRKGESRPLVRASDVAVGDELETRLAGGELLSRVIEVRADEAKGEST